MMHLKGCNVLIASPQFAITAHSLLSESLFLSLVIQFIAQINASDTIKVILIYFRRNALCLNLWQLLPFHYRVF